MKPTSTGIRSLHQIPLDFIKVFTWDKSFKNNIFIGSRLLNRLGLHVFRLVVSHALFNFRLLLLAPLADKKLRDSFWKNGFIRIDEFLPPEEFKQLKQELLDYKGEIREETEGTTATQRLYLTQDNLPSLPQCNRFCTNPRILKLLRYASSKNRVPFFHIENLQHYATDSKRPDPQKDFHSDTFHPCVKAWLYMDDVSEQNGPFIVVPGSHKLTWKRIKWEYRQSLIATEDKASRPKERYWDGSFRFTEQDIAELGYGDPVPMKVPANTLLIANVHAIHRRGDAEARDASRMTVWMQARDNPFNPLFSPFPQLTARAFEFFWKRYTAKRTAQQVRSGHWKVVSGGFVHPRTRK